jgi:hypothetical protein
MGTSRNFLVTVFGRENLSRAFDDGQRGDAGLGFIPEWLPISSLRAKRSNPFLSTGWIASSLRSSR